MNESTRRWIGIAAAVLLLALAVVPAAAADPAKKVLVLGVDGLDPKLLQHFMDRGELPNFKRMIAQGDFKPLQTSMPPLSPIAWSTFITGTDPGEHGIFDFIHRDPATMMPVRAESRALPPGRTVEIGSWVIPVSITSGGIENLRRGRTFWQILEDHDVPTTVFRMPANYPPADSPGKSLSGMGTTDILGTPGTFSFYTDKFMPNARSISGGKVYPVKVKDDVVVGAQLHGPPNSFRRVKKKTPSGETKYENPGLTIDFQVHLDPELPIARIAVQDEEIVLKQGEWSPWVRVDFEAIPLLASISATGRFYLKQVRPDFELYVTPLQINPDDPALQISTPEDWSHELCEDLGYFYTQELPEDTKALSGGVFTGREFWEQSQFVYGERRRAFDYFIDRFDEGLLFFYFSSVDQGSHMLWRWMDPEHPGYEEDDLLVDGIRTLYHELDDVIGAALDKIDDETTFVVMSDHGFSPFNRQVNLNTWLAQKGYVTLRNPDAAGVYFSNVDWSRTQAYALGLNGLYVNLRGRDRWGVVNEMDYDELLGRLERDLLELEDPQTGDKAVSLVVRPRRDFHGPMADSGPDIIVGYNYGYRSSWKSPLGEFTKEIFADNDEAWSGDHAMDYRLVPGVLITNRRITLDEPALHDLTVGILDEYGVDKTERMIGTDCLGGPVAVPSADGN